MSIIESIMASNEEYWDQMLVRALAEYEKNMYNKHKKFKSFELNLEELDNILKDINQTNSNVTKIKVNSMSKKRRGRKSNKPY